MELIMKRGSWSLLKIKKGLYSIAESGKAQKIIITDRYEESGDTLNLGGRYNFESIKVQDLEKAVSFFEYFIYKKGRGSVIKKSTS